MKLYRGIPDPLYAAVRAADRECILIAMGVDRTVT